MESRTFARGVVPSVGAGDGRVRLSRRRLLNRVARVCNPCSTLSPCLAAFVLFFGFAATALAQHPIPENERWATITHAGNAPYPNLSPDGYPDLMGRVDYEYQISRTEVTAAEWIEFVRAYEPYVGIEGGNANFTSSFIHAIRLPGNRFQYELNVPEAANKAIDVSWRYAARFCNWLHNDKQPEQAAFESGAYDTSTFGSIPGQGFTDQHERSPGARYFFPTMDEWVKAAYFDPNCYGLGLPGYWQQPNGTDVPLIPGEPLSPTEPGQTSAGWDDATLNPPDVAAFRTVQSPWGLWDLSGGRQEWLETVGIDPNFGAVGRWLRGSYISGFDSRYYDDIDHLDGAGPSFSAGLRLARVVPSPQVVPGLVTMVCLRRRKRKCERFTPPLPLRA